MAMAQQKNIRGNPLKRHYALWAGSASVFTVTLLIAIKTFAFWQSGAVSILATLIDSLADAVVSMINFLAIRYSLKPADEEHRFGHGKIEGLAALFQAAFIAGAGVFLLFESLSRFTAPRPSEDSALVIVIMAVSMALSALLVFIQNRSLDHAPSLAVEAERAHYVGDIAINGGVIAVLVAMRLGAPQWLDPAFAIVVAAYLGYVARDIAGKGVDMLLDRELPDESREKIRALVHAHPAVRGMHDLRTRKSGMNIDISFDIELDPEQSLRKAHEVTIALEKELLKLFPNAEILIHKDPAGIRHTDSRHQVCGVHDQ